ncbi:tannase [Fannyhessea vaginae]|uniref:tannase n=1 Tax=Fannyhessea vaginae TaxID=82135 RepID=UPI001F20D436|nr:tannase [Fannyhessea vaginae]
MIYVYAGFRGRSSGFESDKKEMFSGGAPWSVVDLKSAIRFLRYNASALPANTDNIFTLSYGAGATISSVLGSSGDSDLYTSYLKKVGAATHDSKGNTISDKIAGCALWCPLLDAELGDCAYEWMMGQFVTDESRKANSFKKQLSSDLAQEYAARLNELGLCDNQNERLLLSKLDDGSYCDGSYYNYVMKTLTDAATDFITHTQFPYVQTPSRLMEPAFPGNLNEKCVSSTTKESESSSSAQDGSKQKLSGDSTPSDKTSTGVSKVQGTSYETPSSYLASLNSDTRWITYSSSKGTVTISNLWEFVKHCKIPNKAVCAFDALDKSTPSNQLFGVDNESTLHFDAHVAHLLAEHQDAYKKDSAFDTKLVDAYRNDLDKKDSLGSSQQLRINALNPLYNLCGSSEGFGKAQVAPFWRINTGLMQQASPLTTELNLVAALKHYDGVKDVQFTPVWDKGFELAEIKGHPQDNAIQWVSTCVKQLSALQEQKEQQEQDEQSQDDSSN